MLGILLIAYPFQSISPYPAVFLCFPNLRKFIKMVIIGIVICLRSK
jgi:hypothetical protein